MINISDAIGTLAAILTTVSFVPQAIQSYRTRDLTGVSLAMYSVFTSGVALWMIYGLMKQDWPLIVANGITFCLAFSILLLKIKQVRNDAAR